MISPIKHHPGVSNHFDAAGRGVLIDYATWAEKKGIRYSTFSTHQVKLSGILEIAKECNITFQRGDILLVRIGATKEWDTVMTDAQKQAYSNNSRPEHAGVEASTDVLRWLWDTGFAAIAGDAISWEVSWPLLKGMGEPAIGLTACNRCIHLRIPMSSFMNTFWRAGECPSVS